jgi:methylthioribulose-1-phosphate dehydratase
MNSLREELAAIIHRIYLRGWCPATAGNYSVRLPGETFKILVSPSGVDKANLRASGLIEISSRGDLLYGEGKPSAEYLLHLAVYEELKAAAVLHVHTIWNTLLSKEFLSAGAIQITGWEILKGLSGVTSHNHVENVPILENSQDMVELSQQLRLVLREQPMAHGFLLAGHGLYTWGDSIQAAYRHLEALEFLFELYAREGIRRGAIPNGEVRNGKTSYS